MLNENKKGKNPDDPDLKGHQPAKYYKGLSKSTKKKRQAQFKKQGEMSDDNPNAYKKVAGDSKKTKPSKYTKKYKEMFGESIKDYISEVIKNLKVVAYHASNAKINKFNLDFVGKGNDQYGTGIYFSTNKDSIKHYGKYIYEVELNISTLLDESNIKNIPKSTIVKLIKNNPDWKESAENFDENPNIGLKIAVEGFYNYEDTERGLMEIVWGDFFRYKPKLFCESATKVGIDGIKVNVTNEDTYYIIYNPKVIKILNVDYNITEEYLKGGLSDDLSINDIAKKHNVDIEQIKNQLEIGIKVELEHTNSKINAKEIAMDHLAEHPDYYTKLKKIETTNEFIKNYIHEALNKNSMNENKQQLLKEFSEKIKTGIKNKSKETGIPVSILNQVARRGAAAWKDGHRAGANQAQWIFGRINSFATGGKTRQTADKDLWAKVDKDKMRERRKKNKQKNEEVLPISRYEIISEVYDILSEAIYKGEKVKLYDIKYTPKGDSKKFEVFVKSGKKTKDGQIKAKKLKLGSPSMEIKRDDPERLKSFRARFKCDSAEAKNRDKKRFWNCKTWQKGKKVSDLVKEDLEKQNNYKKGCLMLQLEFDKWDNILSMIPEEEIHNEDGFGLETDPHLTLLYGFDGKVIYEEVESLLKKIPLDKLKGEITGISCFENKDYDVLKFDVSSPLCEKIHELFKTAFNVETDFPDYNPHITMGYLKKGCGKNYVKKFDKPKPFEDYIISYSHPTDEKEYFSLKEKKSLG